MPCEPTAAIDRPARTVTSQASWQSSAPTVATVNSAGLVSAVAAGEADITATYQSLSGKSHVTVTRATPTTFTISGTVTDGTSGGVLPGIAVSAASQSTTTGSSGAYSFAGVSPGSVTVAASATGYVSNSKLVTIGK